MLLLFRRVLKQMLLFVLIGFVIRKLMASSNPRVNGFGRQTNRVLGGFVGLDETGNRVPRRRAVGRSAGSAFVGGAISYFFDPQQGRERRERVKEFASQRLHRAGEPLALPSQRFDTTATAVERSVPRAASG